jgi:two-component system cell cycle sensor histidine kinase/response regulator CckA
MNNDRPQNLAARYEAMLAAVPDIIVEVDRDKVYTWANQAALDFFGADLLGKEAADYFVGPQDTYEKVQRLFEGDESVFYVESWQRRRDGQKRLLAWWCRVLKDAQGRVVGALSTARDITERRQTEEALRRQLDELFAVFNGVDGAVYIADMQTNEVLAANEHVERIYGSDWRGLKCYELLQKGQNGPCPFCTNDMLVRPDGTPAPPVVWEFQNTRTQRRYQCIDRAIRWPDGRLVRLEIALDITERRRAEDEKAALELQLRRAHKMEAIGQLAGGVAHDFNNVLTAIMGNVDMLRSQLERASLPNDEWVGQLDQIERAAQRAAALTHQLLAFSRRQPVRQAVLDLNQVLSDMRPMLARLISEDIALELQPGEDLARVRADSGQIEQVIMNLVVNARDAMPEGGRIVLETANAIVDELHVAAHPEARPGAYVLLMVRDTGCGMTPEILEHAFEPFFTTKPLGQGTGLGLATVYGIVRQAGGHVLVSSQAGRGTSFRVYWPALEVPLPAAALAWDEGRGLGGSETVLLCEDDAAVRDLAVHFLRAAGYTVLAAEDGRRALDLAGAHAGPIDLLITDVIMPEVDGRYVSEALSAARPALKTLYMSGYPASVVAQRRVLDTEIQLLEKPFTRERLLRCVRMLLDQGQTAARPA